MSFKKCPKCGSNASESASFCPNCGESLLQSPKPPSWIKIINIICIVFGFLAMLAVLGSKGGPSGNANAMILGWFLTIGGITFLFALKEMNQILALISSAFYIIAVFTSSNSIDIAISYLILELILGIVLIINCYYMKKIGVFSFAKTQSINKKRGRNGWVTVLAFVAIISMAINIISFYFGNAEAEKETLPTVVVASHENPDSAANSMPEPTLPSSESMAAVKNAVYGLGDSVEVEKGIIMTILSAGEYESDNQFIQPADGKIYYKVDVEIANNSDKDTAISSIVNTEAYVDDYSIDETYPAGIDNMLSGELAAGKKIKGSLVYEVDSDFKVLELQYKPNIWLKNKVVFEFKNE